MGSNSERPKLDEVAADDFAKVVNQSKEKLHGEDPPPGRRNKTDGRPKKDGRGRPTVEEREAEEREAELKRRESAEKVTADLSPALSFAVAMPFDYAAEKTGCTDLALNENEKNALGNQANEVLKQYLPQIPPEHAALSTFATSLILVSAGKFLQYRRWLMERVKAAEKPAAAPKPADVPGGAA